MAIRIGEGTAPDFDRPLDLLAACHRRIERFTDTLLACAEGSDGGALSGDRRQAFEAALGYFRTAGPLHTADEEASLFPRMRLAGNPAAGSLRDTLDALEADHRNAELAHARVDAIAARWLAEGTLPDAALRSLVMDLRDLRRLYDFHIALEDDDVFPLAAGMLTASDLEAIGREMRARRESM